jgi:bifunctional oligoribonuclease and PAP phosphatase NrnA
MTVEKEKFLKAYEKILKADNILLVTHERPDGDAFSCVCAAIEIMERLGKKYDSFCHGDIPPNFNFLPHIEKIKTKKEDLDFKEHDLIIVFDCGSIGRTKLEEEIKKRKENQFLIEFDHHPKIKDYSDLEIRDPEAAATTEILYYFFKYNNLELNKNIADCILTGILTDTGNFIYPSTSEKTAEIASEMLAHGASFARINQNTIKNKTLDSMKLWGKVLNNLKINKKYQIAVTWLTNNDLKELEDEESLESLAGFLSGLQGVKGLLFVREFEKGFIKGSLRSSHSKMDISKLAISLNGGGHAKTSGFSFEGELIEKNGKIFVV